MVPGLGKYRMRVEPLIDVATDDVVQPFQVDRADVRGRLVRLGPAFDRVLAGRAYPDAVANLLGELLVVAVATAGAFKFHGTLSLQTSSDGPVPLLIAEYRAPADCEPGAAAGHLRGYARFDAEGVRAAVRESALDRSTTQRLLGKGSLAFTVEAAPGAERYQSVTALDGPSIVESVHAYFRQSDQIDAAIRIDVGRVVTPTVAHSRATPGVHSSGARASEWRAGGVLVQRMPGKNYPERDDEEWRRALALVGSASRIDLLDPNLSARDMLLRLFPKDEVRVYRPMQVEAGCRCSRERVDMVLRSFPATEIADMVVEGEITVTCEFCNARYGFAPRDLGL